ncbi:Acyl-ACP thioesterase [uncultured Clostridium sp.]|jgi:acyl-ACP thioesterase|nr:Acyl-ACP thioesterase [uncultured Clostridium sp.]
MYTFDSKVRYSEIDHRGTMTLPALINYFQDCSTFESESLGFGVKAAKEKKKAWILSYWQVVVERYPELGEEITVGTFASDFKGLFGERNFVMLDKENNRLSCANSLWVYMDMEKGRPILPDKEEIEAYGTEPKLDMDYEGRKIRPAAEYEDREAFPVRKYHIDTNEHVNNCQYVQFAMELLPKDQVIHQVRVGYKKSAVLGDVIYPKYAKETDRTVIELCDENGVSYATVEVK